MELDVVNANFANMELSARCAVCSQPAGKSCSACYAVSYCSVEHQKSDWKKHKALCQAFKVETDEEFGRHLVAARDLKAGSLVLKECPVSVGPKVPYIGNDDLISVCLGCCCIMMDPRIEFRRCSKCKWPICSSGCEKLPHHAENECGHFAKNNVKFPEKSNDDYYNILILRTCLLKQKSPAVWKSVLTLQHESSLVENDKLNQKNKEKAKKLVELFKISDKVSEDEWMRISKTIDLNAYGMNVNYHSGKGQPPRVGLGSILTVKGSMFSHSCAPNCSWTVSPPAADMTMQVRTAVDVIKGEMLTIAYNVQLNLIGTQQRRKTIPNFLCKCVRCEDPTEVGSNASTFVCPKCKVPTLVPTNPLDDSAPWKCDSCGFLEMDGYTKDANMVRLFHVIADKDPKELQAFISKYSGTHVHKNHWIITEATRKLVKYLGDRRSHDFSPEERELYISSCKHLLKVANVTSPGISKERAHLQHLIAKEIMSGAMQEYSKKTLPLVEFQKRLKTVEQMQDEAYKFFKTDCTEAINGAKSPIALYLEEQMNLVKFIYRGSFTMETK